ncbi:MAG: (Dimethylallyl)adenosine tRNA methylthiotransferase MiaB [Candidatus Roizmanbacteria bacterium GW2011_GWA2_36_23]|uniref:tRNA-2-methylthio-N(6)-dimethylallyladenosine synthase n=1 Tax=Candidatus Roizmanbacteria bacterium GW2011_GWA2_36_23 TaxID=1618480 RepID=A0A0G0GQQ9_9BACT|nr:MAG: (Dimethylallyl)adenosine tRNA methylthiotransferase MiaB [Candidatus Roizmanbacteria bacterium GW2011_GWA2_36_23]
MKYFIKTFGCQQNKADSERIESSYKARGMTRAKNYQEANHVIINTCMVRESAENRVYGLVNNLVKLSTKARSAFKRKIIVTGCMVGLAVRDKTGKYLKHIKQVMPEVDEFMPIEEVGFDTQPLRQDKRNASVAISNGCNNFCTYCVVPYTRGREISRPFNNIIKEAKELKSKGFIGITLLGQNVNSYGADIVKNSNSQYKISKQKPVYVKHLGRYRIPTLFPHLLEAVAKMEFTFVDFISSNPWDFSDELIEVIANNKNISRTIHLPVQSGDDNVLKRMNRWYGVSDYIALISKIKNKIPKIKFTTDIIVGFCGETEEEFQNTVNLCKKVGFQQAFIAEYSPRFGTAAFQSMKDDVPHSSKKKRWQILEDLINKPYISKMNTKGK